MKRRLRGMAWGALAGVAFALLETAARYVPASWGTDLVAEPGLPVVAALAYAAIGAVAGTLHAGAGLAAPVLLTALAPGRSALDGGLGLVAGALGWLGARHPRASAVCLLAAAGAVALLPRPAPPRPGQPQRPDVLLVVLDTVGANHTSLHGFTLDTTPTLERLAAEGVWFRNAVATAPWTVPSHASLFTGEHPRVAGCHHEHPELPDTLPTTAQILAETGYRTGAFVGNPWVGRFNGLTRGFEHEESAWEIDRQWRSFAGLRLVGARGGSGTKGGPLLVRRTLDWLDRGGDTPSFAFLNLMEAHSPFHQVPDAGRYGVADPERIGERAHLAQMHGPDLIGYPRPGELEATRRLHAAGIRSADGLVGRLVAELERRGRLDRTWLIVTSDHGEAFGEHGFHGHMLGLYAETLHVPLVMRHPPRLAAGTMVSEVVSLRALHATILEIATGRPHPGSLLGLLRGEEPPRAVVSEQRRPVQVLADFGRGGERDLSRWDERALRVRLGSLVLLRRTATRDGEARLSLFDLARDPGETHNLWPDPRGDRLRRILEDHDAIPVAGSGGPELPGDLRARLEALGYLGGG